MLTTHFNLCPSSLGCPNPESRQTEAAASPSRPRWRPMTKSKQVLITSQQMLQQHLRSYLLKSLTWMMLGHVRPLHVAGLTEEVFMHELFRFWNNVKDFDLRKLMLASPN